MGVFHSNARTIRNLDIHSKSDYVIVVYLVDEQFVVSTYLTLVFFLRTFPVFGQIPTIFFRLLTPASCQNKSIQQSLDITLFASFRCSILFGFPLTPPNQKNTTSAVRIFLATNNFVGMPEFSSFIKRSFSLSSPFRLLWKSFEY